MPTEPERRRYIVGATKIPFADRDVAHSVIGPRDDRGFLDMIGADTPDEHPVFPVGSHTTYAVDLTDEEAERFAAASNCRYIEPDATLYDAGGVVSMPAASTMQFMRADFARADQFHGRDVLIGVLDGGTTAAVRSYLGATMVARQNFQADDPGADEITSEHGCLVAPCCVPPGGRFLDAIVSNNAGNRTISASVAAARWCVDNGATVLNYSGAGAGGLSTAWEDMFQYLADRGAQIFISMGNDGLNEAYTPAVYSTSYTNCHSSIAWDENTGARASFSNWTDTADGCAPGANVLGLSPAGVPLTWDGTSASAPHMALLCAMGMTGGRYTAAQVGAALKAHTRDTGQPEQGRGAYSLEAALTALGAFSSLPAQVFRRNLSENPSVETATAGYAVASTRTGITASALGRANTIATPFGAYYLSTNVAGDGTTSTTTPDIQLGLPVVPVTAGKPYVFSVHSRHLVTGATLQWVVRWEDDAGTNLATNSGVKSPLLVGPWSRYHMVDTAPAGATKARAFVWGWGFTDATARSWRLDGFHIEQAAALGTYFDGSTTGARWDGAANGSTSSIGLASGGGGTALDYHPVAIVWPTSDKWPDDGEYDFMENGRPGDTQAEAYLHYPHAASVPVQQEHAVKTGVDLSQWHHFAIEKGPDGITGYLDGVQWFHYAGGAISGTRKNIQDMPSGHLTLQLDALAPSGLNPAVMEVDWVRVYSLTPQGGGGGGGGTGTLAQRLRLGAGDGLTKTNLGIDFLPGQGPSGKQGTHVDYPLNILTQDSLPAEFAGYCDLRDDGAVRLTAYVGAATTPNSTHSRTEFRELAENGTDKATWPSTSGRHYVWVKGAVIRLGPGRPHMVIAQIHDSADDVATIRVEGTNVVATYGDSGRPGTLATGLTLGSVHEWMLETVRSGSTTTINYYWDDMTTPKATQDYSGAAGNYFKAGNYHQSTTSDDNQGEQFVLDQYDLEMWHTGYPEPTARH